MKLLRIAAFSDGHQGGNPAGVWVGNTLPCDEEMQRVAAEVGYSETVFATPMEAGWRVRYFSPEREVPFCGHATIALGAVLALEHGDGVFELTLNDSSIQVEGKRHEGVIAASLHSPPTRSAAAPRELIAAITELFGYSRGELDWSIPPAIVRAGAQHFVFALRTRAALARMSYDFHAGRELMRREGLVTVLIAFAESPRRFHTRNPFAYGGVYEDPATGAATAALAGYLRDIAWPHEGSIDVEQGVDMGMPSRLHAAIGPELGSSIHVSGTARLMRESA